MIILEKQVRKVQRQALHSLSITLPAEWCSKNDVTVGTYLVLMEVNDSTLKIEKMKE